MESFFSNFFSPGLSTFFSRLVALKKFPRDRLMISAFLRRHSDSLEGDRRSSFCALCHQHNVQTPTSTACQQENGGPQPLTAHQCSSFMSTVDEKKMKEKLRANNLLGSWHCSMGAEVCSLGRHPRQVLTECLLLARHSILVSIFLLGDVSLHRLLLEKLQAQVEVCLLVDAQQNSSTTTTSPNSRSTDLSVMEQLIGQASSKDTPRQQPLTEQYRQRCSEFLQELQQAGATVHRIQLENQGLWHHKWLLVDHCVLVRGSCNWSWSALHRNAEHLSVEFLPRWQWWKANLAQKFLLQAATTANKPLHGSNNEENSDVAVVAPAPPKVVSSLKRNRRFCFARFRPY